MTRAGKTTFSSTFLSLRDIKDEVEVKPDWKKVKIPQGRDYLDFCSSRKVWHTSQRIFYQRFDRDSQPFVEYLTFYWKILLEALRGSRLFYGRFFLVEQRNEGFWLIEKPFGTLKHSLKETNKKAFCTDVEWMYSRIIRKCRPPFYNELH